MKNENGEKERKELSLQGDDDYFVHWLKWSRDENMRWIIDEQGFHLAKIKRILVKQGLKSLTMILEIIFKLHFFETSRTQTIYIYIYIYNF
jgi:hypothetical protein